MTHPLRKIHYDAKKFDYIFLMIKNEIKFLNYKHSYLRKMTTYADQYEWLRAQPKWRTIVNNAGIKGIARKLTVDNIIPILKAKFAHIKLPWNIEAIEDIKHSKDLANTRNGAVGSLQSIFNTSHNNIMRLTKYVKYLSPEQEILLHSLINLREFPKTFQHKIYEAHQQKNELKLLKYYSIITKMYTDLLKTIEEIDYNGLELQYRIDNPIKAIAPRQIDISGQELMNCRGDIKGLLFNKLSS